MVFNVSANPDRAGISPLSGRWPHPLMAMGLSALVALSCWAGPAEAQEARAVPRSSSERRIPESLSFAHGLFRQRKFDLAAEEYQRFLESGPSPADANDARFGLASARRFQSRYKEARRAFQDFLDKAPDHPRARTARYRLGELSYILGDLPEARKSLESFLADSAKHPNQETAWTYLGDVRFGLDDLPAARTAYERSLADFPQGQLADRSRYGLGRTLAGLNQTDAALKVFNELAHHGGSDWIDRAWLQIGKIQLANGGYAASAEALEALGRKAPRSGLKPEADLLRAEALAHLDRAAESEKLLRSLIAGGAEPVGSRAVLALATLEMERGNSTAALATLDEALKRFPQSQLVPAFLFRSAESLQQQKRTEEARKRFLKVAEIDPHDPWADDAVARAAQLALEVGDHAAALELARSFAGRFPGSKLEPQVRLLEARALLASGQPGEAVKRLEPLLGIGASPGPEEPMDKPKAPLSPAAVAAARYDLALAYRAAGRPADADAMLAALASSSKDPVGADAQFLIGQERVDQGRFAEAIGPLNQYLSVNPRGEVADHCLAHLATAQVGLGQADEAWKTLDRLADGFPQSKTLPMTRLRLAESALAADQAVRAVEQFRLVLDPAPTGRQAPGSSDPAAPPIDLSLRARAQAGLGRALWKLGKPAEAAAVFTQFLETASAEPTAPAVALDRAGALAAAGQTEAALSAYQQLAQRYSKTDESLQAQLSEARLLARTGHPAEAATVYGTLLSDQDRLAKLEVQGEKHDALLAERGWAMVDARKTAEADAVFGELLKAYPQSRHAIDARFNLAESANQAGDHAEVVRLLSPLVTSQAVPVPGATAPSQGGSATTGSVVDRGKAGPDNKTEPGKAPQGGTSRMMPLVLYRLGRTQIELGDWAAAEATLDRLIREFPGSSRNREARFLRAEAALRQDHPADAEAILTALEAEPLDSADPEGFIRLVRGRHVQSLLGVKRWKDALTRAEALKQELPPGDPAVAELDFARGRALLGLARPDDARAAFQSVITARKGGDLAAQAHLMRGETYFHQERYREALTEFLKVDILYEVPRWQAAALLEAGKVYERLAQWGDAAETYERLCSRFPKDPRVAEAKERLEAARKHGSARAESGGKVL